MTEIVTAADSVVSIISSMTAAETFTVTRSFKPEWDDLGATGGYGIYVVPVSETFEFNTRNGGTYTMTINVPVFRRLIASDYDISDDLTFTGKVRDTLMSNRILATGAVLTGVDIGIYDPELLEKNRMYASRITATYVINNTY